MDEKNNTNQSNDSRNQYRQNNNSGRYPRQTPGNGRYVKKGTQPSGQTKKDDKPEEMSAELIKQAKRKTAKKKMIVNNLRRVCIILGVILIISFSVASIGISCINDVLAIHVSEKDTEKKSVVIEEGMNTEAVIDELDDAGVIKNAIFCKIAAKFIGYNDDGYIARTYDFSRSMGLENMLNEIKNISSSSAKTVTLTFPEGYTADQIIEMLEDNDVCSREKIIETITTVDFSTDYDFVKKIDKANRYNVFEGYLFPDTYDFYIGETADSVIKKFLTNFEKKWSDDYADLATEKKLSTDEVLILASIVEKEAVGEDMPIVASVLINRLDAGMKLECDSTSIYISQNKSGLTQQQVDAFNTYYDTYSCATLPVGAICNPGSDAIEAVLNSTDTGYYYFMHDTNNVFHVAKTLSEHENNIATYGLAQ